MKQLIALLLLLSTLTLEARIAPIDSSSSSSSESSSDSESENENITRRARNNSEVNLLNEGFINSENESEDESEEEVEQNAVNNTTNNTTQAAPNIPQSDTFQPFSLLDLFNNHINVNQANQQPTQSNNANLNSIESSLDSIITLLENTINDDDDYSIANYRLNRRTNQRSRTNGARRHGRANLPQVILFNSQNTANSNSEAVTTENLPQAPTTPPRQIRRRVSTPGAPIANRHRNLPNIRSIPFPGFSPLSNNNQSTTDNDQLNDLSQRILSEDENTF